jgi:hypothetical protein
MIHMQNSKYVSLFKPQSVATNGTATGTVSCVGFRYARVVLHLDTAADATNTDATVTLTEGDGTTFATHADLNVTTHTPSTANQNTYIWLLDLRKRKKNLKITYTSGPAARIGVAHCDLSRAEEMPNSASERGATTLTVA